MAAKPEQLVKNLVKGEQLYEGKAKKVFASNYPDCVVIEYKDDATAFNGEKKGQIESKGILNNNIASGLFDLLDKKGVKSHFIAKLSDREMLCKRVSIIPLEVIVRNVAVFHNEIPDGHRPEDSRDAPFQRLFGGRDQYFLYSGCLEYLSFGVFPDYRDYGVGSDFAGLFREPFVTVIVFGGTYGQMQAVRMSAPVRQRLHDFRLGSLGRIGNNTAFHQVAPAVYDRYGVAAPVSQYPYAVRGLVRIESAYIPFNIFSIEYFHDSVSRAKIIMKFT